MCEQHHLLEGNLLEGQLLVHCNKVSLNGRRKDNRNTFCSLVPGGKEKISVVKIIIFYKRLEYKMYLIWYAWTISYPEISYPFLIGKNLWERYWYINFAKENLFWWHYQNKVLTVWKQYFRGEHSQSTIIVPHPNLRNNNSSSILFQ